MQVTGGAAETENRTQDQALYFARQSALAVGVAAVVGLLAALAVSLAIPPQYRATAQLYLAPASNATVAFQDVILGQNLARSCIQLVTADVVLRPVMADFNVEDSKSFRARA